METMSSRVEIYIFRITVSVECFHCALACIGLVRNRVDLAELFTFTTEYEKERELMHSSPGFR